MNMTQKIRWECAVSHQFSPEKRGREIPGSHVFREQLVTAEPFARHASGFLSALLHAMNAAFCCAQRVPRYLCAAMSTAPVGGTASAMAASPFDPRVLLRGRASGRAARARVPPAGRVRAVCRVSSGQARRFHPPSHRRLAQRLAHARTSLRPSAPFWHHGFDGR